MQWPFVFRTSYEALRERCKDLEATKALLVQENGEYRHRLKQAEKNDMPKDPITGRFTKR